MNKETKRYLKDIKRLFPVFSKEEKQYYKRIEDTILKNVDQNTTYADCIKQFGTPKDTIIAYYEEMDSDILMKKIHSRHYKRNFLLGMLIFALILSLLFTLFLYKTSEDAKRNHAFDFEDTIEVIE